MAELDPGRACIAGAGRCGVKGWRKVGTRILASREIADRAADGLFLVGYRTRVVNVRVFAARPEGDWSVTWYEQEGAVR